MALVGNVYIQDADPGAVGFGYDWRAPTTGAIKTRNTTNTAWVSVGNANSATLGMLSREGGAMTGAITGVTGWAPENNPDFNTSAKLDGVDLATMNDLTDLQDTLTEMINNLVTAGLASMSASMTISNMIAWKSGTVASGGTIPLPSYSDRQATHDEIVLLHVGLGGPTGNGGYDAHTRNYTCTVNETTRVVTANVSHNSGETVDTYSANYLIVCVKKQ